MEMGKISKLAVVETDRIGSNVTIGEFSVVRKGAVLGDDVVIHPHVVIESDVTIGKGTEIFPSTYIGKEPKGAGATARNLDFIREVAIGEHCCVGPNAVIYCDVQIGDSTLVGDAASIREKSRVVHVQVPTFFKRQVLVNVDPGAKVIPSGTVTSVTNWARSQVAGGIEPVLMATPLTTQAGSFPPASENSSDSVSELTVA